MNVTEAVDSLSAMFHPSAQVTQPHLPSYHVQEFSSAICSHRCWKPDAPFLKWLRFRGDTHISITCFNQTHTLKSFKTDHNLSAVISLISWISNFRTSSFSPSPYKHVTTCPRRTLATHSRHNMFTCTSVDFDSEPNKLLQLWRQTTTFYCVPKNCPSTL